MKTFAAFCVSLGVALVGPASSAPTPQVNSQNLLTRWYEVGERVSYKVTGTVKDRAGTTSFAAAAKGTVKQDETKRFFEELEWSDLVWNTMPVQIPAANQAFRQILSLSPDFVPPAPDMSRAYPRLVGPIVDLQALYADVSLAMQQPKLQSADDRVVLFRGDTKSWADGMRVTLGEDAADFELTLGDVNMLDGTATLKITHVPPAQPKIKLPADWMRMPVAGGANNWVQVIRAGPRQFLAAVGSESADIDIQLSLANGKIYSARINNPIDVLERECTDEALTMCREGSRYQIVRQVAIVQGP